MHSQNKTEKLFLEFFAEVRKNRTQDPSEIVAEILADLKLHSENEYSDDSDGIWDHSVMHVFMEKLLDPNDLLKWKEKDISVVDALRQPAHVNAI